MGDIVVSEHRPLSVAEVKADVNLMQHVLREVMQPNVHYGKIPGCGDKPALFKPGAEKIMAAFRIAAEPEVQDLSSHDEARYRVMCKGISIGGRLIGTGVGECSSNEEKYRWRRAICDGEFDETPEERRRKKWRRDGTQEKQVRTAPADVANTVLKMAKKRALIDMVLTCTAASDIFTQDIDEDAIDAEHAPTIQAPQAKSAEAASESPGRFISEAQRKRLYAIYKGAGKTDDEVKRHLQAKYNVSSSKDITLDMYDEVCEWAGKKG